MPFPIFFDVYVCTYTCLHSDICTCTLMQACITYIHECLHTCMHEYIHTHKCTYTYHHIYRPYTQPNIPISCMHIHTYIHAYIHTWQVLPARCWLFQLRKALLTCMLWERHQHIFQDFTYSMRLQTLLLFLQKWMIICFIQGIRARMLRYTVNIYIYIYIYIYSNPCIYTYSRCYMFE